MPVAALTLDDGAHTSHGLLGHVAHVAAYGDVHLPEEVHQGLCRDAQLLGDF